MSVKGIFLLVVAIFGALQIPHLVTLATTGEYYRR